MKNSLKNFRLALMITSIILASTSTIAVALTVTTQIKLDQTKEFLSNVVGLDMSKYSLTDSPYRHNNTRPVNTYPPQTKDINMETAAYFFKTDNGVLEILSIFYNGKLTVVNINPTGNDPYVYNSTTEKDLTSQVSTLLTRYSEFLSQKSSIDTTFLTPMKSAMNSVNVNSNVNITTDNINLQISKNENKTILRWIYFDYNVIMNYKKVEINFNDNNSLVSFQDTYSLYNKVAEPIITKEQAIKIALDAAQKVINNASTIDGRINTIETPDLSSTYYDIQFGMVPCNNVEKDLSLDLLTLYPFWEFHFYFNQSYAGADGVQVGVLGDTGTIYTSGFFGYLGGGRIPLSVITTATDTDISNLAANNFIGLILMISAIIVIIVLVSVPIALHRKMKRK
jgi:hypothetical protein